MKKQRVRLGLKEIILVIIWSKIFFGFIFYTYNVLATNIDYITPYLFDAKNYIIFGCLPLLFLIPIFIVGLIFRKRQAKYVLVAINIVFCGHLFFDVRNIVLDLTYGLVVLPEQYYQLIFNSILLGYGLLTFAAVSKKISRQAV